MKKFTWGICVRLCERAMLGNIDHCVSEKKCVPEGMCKMAQSKDIFNDFDMSSSIHVRFLSGLLAH